MCLAGNEAEIIAALDALKNARELRAKVDRTEIKLRTDDLDLSREEVAAVLDCRIGVLESKCRELGCHGPAPKADRGDSTRIVSSK